MKLIDCLIFSRQPGNVEQKVYGVLLIGGEIQKRRAVRSKIPRADVPFIR